MAKLLFRRINMSNLKSRLFGLALALFCAIAAPAVGAEKDGPGRLKIYVDADFTITKAAATTIVLGLKTALAEIDHEVAGYALEVVEMDHRGTPKRSHHNMKRFLKDPDAIAVVGGMQSPPYLAHREFINSSKIPLLVAWAAAAPLTRGAVGDRNFIFRLSIDDTKAGPFLLRQALASGCERLAIFLVDTGWGRANRGTIQAALSLAGVGAASIDMVSPEIGPVSALNLVNRIGASNPDCAITVLTSHTGAQVLNAFYEAGLETRLLSHWGLLGSDFQETVPHEVREFLDLTVLQTCGLERQQDENPVLARALDQAGLSERGLGSLAAPAGFTHGYDLGLILRAALARAIETPEWSDDPTARRVALRNALESIPEPIEGTLKTYAPPFRPTQVETPDGHEALNGGDLCFARFLQDGTIIAFGQG